MKKLWMLYVWHQVKHLQKSFTFDDFEIRSSLQSLFCISAEIDFKKIYKHFYMFINQLMLRCRKELLVHFSLTAIRQRVQCQATPHSTYHTSGATLTKTSQCQGTNFQSSHRASLWGLRTLRRARMNWWRMTLRRHLVVWRHHFVMLRDAVEWCGIAWMNLDNVTIIANASVSLVLWMSWYPATILVEKFANWNFRETWFLR